MNTGFKVEKGRNSHNKNETITNPAWSVTHKPSPTMP